MRSEKVPLNNGVLMDRIGYGLYKVPPSDAETLCTQALDAGYRMLDTAALYANEAGVGQAVHRFTSERAEASREARSGS